MHAGVVHEAKHVPLAFIGDNQRPLKRVLEVNNIEIHKLVLQIWNLSKQKKERSICIRFAVGISDIFISGYWII